MTISKIFKRIKKRAIDNIALLSLYQPTIRQRKDYIDFRNRLQNSTEEEFEFYLQEIVNGIGSSIESAMEKQIDYIVFPNVGSFRINYARKEILDYIETHKGNVVKEEVLNIRNKWIEKTVSDKKNNTKNLYVDLSKLYGEEN